MRRTISLLYWLMPGIGIKRWLLLFSGGIFVASLGLAITFNAGILIRAYSVTWWAAYNLTGRYLPTLWGSLLILLGIFVMALAVQKLVKGVLDVLLPTRNGQLGNLLYQQRQLERGPRIVALGGGTGLSTLLRGLKHYTMNLTAVVTVADDGGSSGKLRGELGILPPGDIRNCLVALADTEPMMESLFQHRFDRGSLKGHSFGNLLIGALTEMLGDFEKGVQEASKVLAIRGKVLPSTLEQVELCARFRDGETVCGESKIAADPRSIESVFLKPRQPAALPAVCEAIEQADMIIIGPGSLYTSVLPNLLIPEIAERIRKRKVPCVYVVNIMTQPGESDGYKASDHLAAIEAHLGKGMIDAVVVNTERIPEGSLRNYLKDGAEPVKADKVVLERMGYQVITGSLVEKNHEESWIRHDHDKLASLLFTWFLHQKTNIHFGWGLHYLMVNRWIRRNSTAALRKNRL